MNVKRCGLALSIGIGAVAVLILLGFLSRPGTATAAESAPVRPRLAEEVAALSVADASPVRYVASSGTDSGDCSTPAGACRTLQYALDQAGGGDQIRVATGVYTDVHAREGITQVVYISKSVSLAGGYLPPFDAPPNPIARPTILDAQGRGRVVYIAGDITVTLTGLQITGGDASGDDRWSSRGTGGGVYATGAAVTISESQVYSNTGSRDSDGGGGGLAFVESDVTLVDNLIRGNKGCSGLVVEGGGGLYGVGGGLFIADSAFNIVDNQILSNTALISEGLLAYGGGVAIGNSSGQFVDNLIDGNVAAGGGDGFGGGLYFESNRDDWLTIRSNVVQNNVASCGEGLAYGGGIYILTTGRAATADVRLSDNVLQGNIAAVTRPGIGGGLVALAQNTHSMTLAFLSNLVLSNTATLSGSNSGLGGGVVVGGVHADFKHNHFVGNSAGIGSAVYFSGSHADQQADILRGNVAQGSGADPGGSVVFEDSDITSSNLVVVDNRTTSKGGAILVLSSNVNLVHATLARNTGGSGVHVADAIYSSPRTRSEVTITNTILVSHTVGISVTSGHTATLDGVLWYSNNINYGGAGSISVTKGYTGDPAFAADGYHLTAASAAIDRGVNAGVEDDIDGDPRPLDRGYDLGADEFSARWYFYLPLVARDFQLAVKTGNVLIRHIYYDGVGSLEPDEYVELRNDDSVPIQLEGWTLRNEAGKVFTFPSFEMQPGQACRVYTNEDHPEWCGFAYGSAEAIWDNTRDTAYLRDSTGALIDTYSYPGLIIQGHVWLDREGGPGLANVNIYRAFASYGGVVVATTDADGYYQSGFTYIPGDEMVRVWAELEGYTFEPEQYYWRHYHGRESTTLNFVATAKAAARQMAPAFLSKLVCLTGRFCTD